LYKESDDQGFVEACEALLADKLMTLQWWEEDRADDGFYTIRPKKGGYPPKALSFCHRPDGVVLGIWKRGWSALTADEGKSWTELVQLPTLRPASSKAWIQRTEDGRYALVYNHSATKRNRFPLAVMTSDDCHEFDSLLCIDGEVPPQRYQGFHKDLGIQYIRGIAEGNGNPPGDYMWNTFSVNKEDIWVSRTKVPISGTVDGHINQDFQKLSSECDLELWNLYIPKWGVASIIDDPQRSGNKCLELRDEEPHDYTRAQRVFPQSKKVRVDFKVLISQLGHASLFVEAQDQRGRRPIKLRFESNWLWMDRGRTEKRPVAIRTGRWIDISLELDCEAQKYDLLVNSKLVSSGIKFGQEVQTLESLVFRTGPWRNGVPPLIVEREPAPGNHSEDLLGSDVKSSLSVFLIDDVRTQSL
jgi:hypothetical protein